MDWLEIVVDVVSWAFMLAGAFFLLVGALGMIRLPDFWSRIHAASIIDSAAAFFILIALALQAGLTLVTLKLALIALFLFITGPTASHAVANAAFVAGSRPKDAVRDDTEPFEPSRSPGGLF